MRRLFTLIAMLAFLFQVSGCSTLVSIGTEDLSSYKKRLASSGVPIHGYETSEGKMVFEGHLHLEGEMFRFVGAAGEFELPRDQVTMITVNKFSLAKTGKRVLIAVVAIVVLVAIVAGVAVEQDENLVY